MASNEPSWRVELKRLLCDHDWEHIGWANDMHDGPCIISRCRRCGLRRQFSEVDRHEGVGPVRISRFTVELTALDSPGAQAVTETALAGPDGRRNTR